MDSIIQHRSPTRGFTLIEVLIATVLVGLSIAALVAANASFSMANSAGTDLSTAEFLAEQIRELTAMLPFDDVMALDGFDSDSVGAPIDASKATLNSLANFCQQVAVQKVNPSDFTDDQEPTESDFVRVTVTVLKNNLPINSASWIRAKL